MERRTCKLCFKSFANGRALGGHMRSHMAALQPPPPPEQPLGVAPPPRHTQLSNKLGGDAIESASSSSTSSSSEEEEKEAMLSYGLRENPKKSFRLVDPEFSFAVDAGSVVQDRESETESSKNPSRRRSKRTRKSGGVGAVFLHQQQPQHRLHQQEQQLKKPKLLSNHNKGINKGDSIVEPEPVSSVSDATPEEDVARCLMMLSRGVWARKSEQEHEATERSIDETADEDDDDGKDDDDDEDEDVGDGGEIKLGANRSKAKYQCGTCKKVFRSYQALGGHRASHKKIRGCNPNTNTNTNNLCSSSVVAEAHRATREVKNQNKGNADMANSVVGEDRRVHECPVCFRVFGSGQALGGHKRSHLSGSATTATATSIISLTHQANSTKFADNLIDLNLPAPIEDDDASQIELSAVSDAEFVDPIK